MRAAARPSPGSSVIRARRPHPTTGSGVQAARSPRPA
jgi:hypothetical protein